MIKKINPIDFSETGLSVEEFNEMYCLGLVEFPLQKNLKDGDVVKFRKVNLNPLSEFILDRFRYVGEIVT